MCVCVCVFVCVCVCVCVPFIYTSSKNTLHLKLVHIERLNGAFAAIKWTLYLLINALVLLGRTNHWFILDTI